MILVISPEKVRGIIQWVRDSDEADAAPEDEAHADDAEDEEFDDEEEEEELDDGPVRIAPMEFLSGLDEKELADLVALTWIGQGIYGVETWPDVVAEAAQVDGIAEYLLAIPELSDHLESGLTAVEKTGGAQ